MKSVLLRIRLWRIERALGIHLWPEQRDFVLNDNRYIQQGGRRNGKTMAGNVWMILHRKEPITYSSMQLGLDKFTGRSLSFNDPDWIKNELWHIGERARCVQICYDAGIKTFRMEVKPGVWIGGKPKLRIFRRNNNR